LFSSFLREPRETPVAFFMLLLNRHWNILFVIGGLKFLYPPNRVCSNQPVKIWKKASCVPYFWIERRRFIQRRLAEDTVTSGWRSGSIINSLHL
jgi:hypothetical protein